MMPEPRHDTSEVAALLDGIGEQAERHVAAFLKDEASDVDLPIDAD